MGRAKTYRNLFLTMLLGGLWHGASWNYVWWGVYHGVLLIAVRLAGTGKTSLPKEVARLTTPLRVFVMFQFTLFGWLLFRATRRIVGPDGVSRDDSFRQIIEMVGSFQNGWGFSQDAVGLLGSIALYVHPLVGVQLMQHRSGTTM